jgi:hypothetical protein
VRKNCQNQSNQIEEAMPKNNLGISVLKSAWTSEAKELVVEWAELGIDALMDDGMLKDIPFFGSIVKICGVSKTIRDKLFVRKVWDFLRACPRFTEVEKETFAQAHLNDPEKAQRLGDAIVLILDKLDDLQKPEMLAKVFAALVRGSISLEAFRRLAAAIDIGFLADLQAFATMRYATPDQMRALFPNLVRTGLTEIRGAAMPGEGGMRRISCEIGELGRQFQTHVGRVA